MADAIFAYDANADALYYRLSDAAAARTVDIDGRVMVDVDADGKAVGVEVLNPPGFSSSIHAEVRQLPPEIEAQIEEGRRHPERSVPYRRRTR